MSRELADIVENHGSNAVQDEILVDALRDLDEDQRMATDGSGAMTRSERVPHPNELSRVARVWPLSSRMTLIAGILALGYGVSSMSSGWIVVALVVLGGAIELARAEGWSA